MNPWIGRGAVAVVLSACGPEPLRPSAQTGVDLPLEHEHAPPHATTPGDRPAAVTAMLADRYPSLAYYPSVGASLAEALERRAPAIAILESLGETMAPYRWPSASDWDRGGFVDLDPAAPGFVTRTSAKSVSQSTERYDLGCAGGFLEGVRLLLAPRLGVAELDRCDADTFAIVGAPSRCDAEHDFGWLAIANIAATLTDPQLERGRALVELSPDDPLAQQRLAQPGATHLCSVSHTARTRANQRFHHHLMITLGGPDGLTVFDTTGTRGVAVETMSTERFVRYCGKLLASNREYHYDWRSARLTCLAVRTTAQVQ